MKQHIKQQEAQLFKAPIVVLRWGRHTGKDTLIETLRGKGDFVIEPKRTAADHGEKYEGRMVFIDYMMTDKLIKHMLERQKPIFSKTKKIFLNECAEYSVKLFELMDRLQKAWPHAQIYLISTPRGGWKYGEAGSAGFEFDMLCARLEMTPVHGYDYSRNATKQKDRPPIGTNTNTATYQREYLGTMPEEI